MGSSSVYPHDHGRLSPIIPLKNHPLNLDRAAELVAGFGSPWSVFKTSQGFVAAGGGNAYVQTYTDKAEAINAARMLAGV